MHRHWFRQESDPEIFIVITNRVLCSTYHLENSCLERVEKLDMAALLDPTCKISLMFEETVWKFQKQYFNFFLLHFTSRFLPYPPIIISWKAIGIHSTIYLIFSLTSQRRRGACCGWPVPGNSLNIKCNGIRRKFLISDILISSE